MVAAAAAETVAMATTMLSLLLPIACCFMAVACLRLLRHSASSTIQVPANTMLTRMLATSVLSLIVRVCSTTLQKRDESSSSPSGAAGSAPQHIEQSCRATTLRSVGARMLVLSIQQSLLNSSSRLLYAPFCTGWQHALPSRSPHRDIKRWCHRSGAEGAAAVPQV